MEFSSDCNIYTCQNVIDRRRVMHNTSQYLHKSHMATIYTMAVANKTRMHSSRMCTGRSLTIPGGGSACREVWPAGGVVYLPGVCLPGGSACQGGSACRRGLPARGVASQHALRQTPLLTESQTGVKILPWPNFVAAGNKVNFNLFVNERGRRLAKLDL